MSELSLFVSRLNCPRTNSRQELPATVSGHPQHTQHGAYEWDKDWENSDWHEDNTKGTEEHQEKTKTTLDNTDGHPNTCHSGTRNNGEEQEDEDKAEEYREEQEANNKTEW